MNLSTNLVRRKQELEAIKLSADADILLAEADLKRQELMDANQLVDNLTQQQKSGIFISTLFPMCIFFIVFLRNFCFFN